MQAFLLLPSEVVVRCLSGIPITNLLTSCRLATNTLLPLALRFPIVYRVYVCSNEKFDEVCNRTPFMLGRRTWIPIYNTDIRARLPNSGGFNTNCLALWEDVVNYHLIREQGRRFALHDPSLKRLSDRVKLLTLVWCDVVFTYAVLGCISSLQLLQGSYVASLKGFYLTPSETCTLDTGYAICDGMGTLEEEWWLERLIALLPAILNEDHDGFRAVMQTDAPQSQPPVEGAPELPCLEYEWLDACAAHDVLLTPSNSSA